MRWQLCSSALLLLVALSSASRLQTLVSEGPDDENRAQFEWKWVKAAGPNKRDGHTATFVSGQLVVFGGCFLDAGCFNDLYIYDTTSRAWTRPKPQGLVPPRRGLHTASAVGSKLIVFGGSAQGLKRKDLYVFDIETWEWSKPDCSGRGPTAREGHTSVVYGDKLYIFGGYTPNGYVSDVHVLNTTSMAWITPRKIMGSPPIPRSRHTAVQYNNLMYIFGGVSDAVGDVNSLHAFNLDTNEWMPDHQVITSGPMPSRRHAAFGTVSKANLFVIGGCNFKKNTCYNDTFVLNLNNMQWSKLDVRGVEVAEQKSTAIKPESLISDDTVKMFEAGPTPPPAPPAEKAVEEKLELASVANELASEQKNSTASKDGKSDGKNGKSSSSSSSDKGKDKKSSFLQVAASVRVRSRNRLRLHDKPSKQPGPVLEIGEDAQAKEVSTFNLLPRGGLAGGFVTNTSSDLYLFGGCSLHDKCYWELILLNIPATYKPPVDPFPMENPTPIDGVIPEVEDTPAPTDVPAPLANVNTSTAAPPSTLPALPRFMDDVPRPDDPDKHLLMHGSLPTGGVTDVQEAAESIAAAENALDSRKDSLSNALSQASADLDAETNELRKMMQAFERTNVKGADDNSLSKKSKKSLLSNRIRFVHHKKSKSKSRAGVQASSITASAASSKPLSTGMVAMFVFLGIGLVVAIGMGAFVWYQKRQQGASSTRGLATV